MQFLIRHESAHTLRVHVALPRMSMEEADLLEYYLNNQPYVSGVKVFEQTGDALITYHRTGETRCQLLEALSTFSFSNQELRALVPEESGRALNREYQNKIVCKVLGNLFRKLFFPAGLRMAWSLVKSIRFFFMALKCLFRGRLDVPVLDAAAILASMLREDFETAGSIMFLLETGDILEEWTHKKSVGDLARTLSLKVDKVWLKAGEEEVLVDVNQVKKGDRFVVRTSNIIPLDGVVVSGEVSVNQASMTGESIPVVKKQGGAVYAGTVVEEGECVVEVTKEAGSGKYDQIVRMIEESEKLKSTTESRAYHLADSLVPYALAGTGLTYLFTRNITRAISFLMVDFSCALKLSMPLSVLSGIREAGKYNISVKGGKFLEAVAEAKTIVFDKTGTLTKAEPTVVKIYTFGEFARMDREEGQVEEDLASGKELSRGQREALRLSACLEEHFPHSMANAVVAAAKKRTINHKEMHSEVQYVVAHGIASHVDGKRVVIGSHHFIFEDEKITVLPNEQHKLDGISHAYTQLYLAIGGELAAVLCIFDPLRKEAPEVIASLHALGIDKICMMTGDSEKTAASVANSLHIDEYHAEVLPQDKAAFIAKEHAAGRKVIMVGDGVNDTPALSEADAGVAVNGGAAIAREVADITISADSLYELVKLRKLSDALMKRIRDNYRFIISFNGMLIALGVAGILQPATSALLHNSSTILIGVKSMTDLLAEAPDER